jgi:NIPSNAP
MHAKLKVKDSPMEIAFMNASQKPTVTLANRGKFKGLIIFAVATLAFSAGSLATAYLTHVKQVRADSNHVFELNIYHTIPGKANELEDLFRGDSKYMAKHGLNVIGFWVPNEDPAWKDTFVYVVDFPSREEAKKRWAELHADPDTRPYVEAAKLILEKVNGEFHVDEIYMRPSDFSAMK